MTEPFRVRVLDGADGVVEALRDANILSIRVPRDTVGFHGNGNVLGLRGAGSYDFTVRE